MERYEANEILAAEKQTNQIDIQKELRFIKNILTVLGDISLDDTPASIEFRVLNVIGAGSKEAFEKFGEWMRIELILEDIQRKTNDITYGAGAAKGMQADIDKIENYIEKQKLLVKDREALLMSAVYRWLQILKKKNSEIQNIRQSDKDESIRVEDIVVDKGQCVITPFGIFMFVPDSAFEKYKLEGDAAWLPDSLCILVRLHKITEVKFNDLYTNPGNFMYTPAMQNLFEDFMMPVAEGPAVKGARSVINSKSRKNHLERLKNLEAPKRLIAEAEEALSGVYSQLESPDDKVISAILDIFHNELLDLENSGKGRLHATIHHLDNTPLKGYEKQSGELAAKIRSGWAAAELQLTFALEKGEETGELLEAMILSRILKPSEYDLMLKYLSR